MSDASAPSAPRRRAWWRRPWVWMLAIVLAVAGWFQWREYDTRRAGREAVAMGFEWEMRESPFDVIREDWRAAFRRATWEQERWLELPEGTDLAPLRGLLRRLRLTHLVAWRCRNVNALQGLTGLQMLKIGGSDTKDLTPLAGLSRLEGLRLDGCTGVTNLTPLAGLSQLQGLYLNGCTGVTDLAPLAGLSQLQGLYLNDCTGVTDLAPLAGLSQLRGLHLDGCTGVTNLTPLAGLSQLQGLYLNGCTGVTDLAPLAGLSQLTQLERERCMGLKAEAVETFRKSHPEAFVSGP